MLTIIFGAENPQEGLKIPQELVSNVVKKKIDELEVDECGSIMLTDMGCNKDRNLLLNKDLVVCIETEKNNVNSGTGIDLKKTLTGFKVILHTRHLWNVGWIEEQGYQGEYTIPVEKLEIRYL